MKGRPTALGKDMGQVGGVQLQVARAFLERERLRVVLVNAVQHRAHHPFGPGFQLGDRGRLADRRHQTVEFFPQALLDTFKYPQHLLNFAEFFLLQIRQTGSLQKLDDEVHQSRGPGKFCPAHRSGTGLTKAMLHRAHRLLAVS